MPKIQLLWFGREGKDPAMAVVREYESRITHFTRFERICLPEERCSDEKIIKALGNTSVIVGLDERGIAMSSEDLGKRVQTWESHSVPLVTFVIGGSYGLPPIVQQKATFLMSLGPMTLPHRLAQAVLCEQIYRAYTLVRGLPYHHS